MAFRAQSNTYGSVYPNPAQSDRGITLFDNVEVETFKLLFTVVPSSAMSAVSRRYKTARLRRTTNRPYQDQHVMSGRV